MEHLTPIQDFSSIVEDIDLFICASSFEDRCFSIANQLDKVSKPFSSFIFYNSNEYNKINENALVLARTLGRDSEIVELNSNNSMGNAVIINGRLDKLFNENDIENILLDITTFTHETLLSIFWLLNYKKNKFSSLYIVYTTAFDYSTNIEDISKKWLTSGIQTIRTVVGYPGVFSPAKDNHLIVLFGFESDRTKHLIDDMQFDKISLGFGAENQSINNSFQKENETRHVKILDSYTNTHSFKLSLINPFAAKDAIIKIVQESSDDNIVIASMNTKISTIGVALAAIENPRIQLIYAKPVEYNIQNYSAPGDTCYYYKIF